MKKNNVLLTIACMASLFIGFEVNGQRLSAIKEEIGKDNARYFDLFKKKAGTIVDLYTDDACLLAPNAPAICGRAALTKDFKDTYATGKVNGVKFSTQNIYGDGKEYIAEESTWQVFGTDDKVIDDGKYLKLWKKTSRGWKIFRDSFNSNRKSS